MSGETRARETRARETRSEATAPVVELRGIGKVFTSRRTPVSRPVRVVAAEDVDLALHADETVALVGESGSGKSTLARIALRLLDPDAGSVLVDGQDVTHWSQHRLRPLRKDLAMVFQDPYTSLNPRQSIGRILAAPLLNHGLPHGRARLEQLLVDTGMSPEALDRYPHEFSGGQRQRIGVARAIATNPRVIVADEPVSALDVSVRAQVLNLLLRLRRERGLALLIVSHDLAVVRSVSDRVVVLYLGRIVEEGPVDQVYADPQHPYTQALLAAVPVPDPHRRSLAGVGAGIPLDRGAPAAAAPAGAARLTTELSAAPRPDTGCVFAARCPRVQQVCREVTPRLEASGRDQAHRTACHFPGAEH